MRRFLTGLVYLFISSIPLIAVPCPQALGTLPFGHAGRMIVKDNTAYVLMGRHIYNNQMVALFQDAGDGTFTLVSSIVFPEPIDRFLIYENTIIAIPVHSGKFYTCDLSDPSHTCVRHERMETGDYRALTITGHTLLLGGYSAPQGDNDSFPILDIYDISNVNEPQFISSTPLAYEVKNLFAYNTYAYISEMSYETFPYGGQIVNFSDPAHPIAGNFSTCFLFNEAVEFTVVNNIMLVLGGYDLCSYDLQDPGHPSYIGQYVTRGTNFGMVKDGNHLYVSDRDNGIRVIDIADPTMPVIVTTWDFIDEPLFIGLMGDSLLCDDTDGYLKAFDIADQDNPALTWTSPYMGTVSDIATMVNTAYAATQNGGLKIIDIADPGNPTLVNLLYPDESVIEVNRSGTLLTLATTTTFRVIDLSDPVRPTILGELPIMTDCTSLVHSDTLAVLGFSSGTFTIIDIADPSAPHLLTTFASGYEGMNEMVLINTMLYVTYPYEGDFVIYDLHNPADPIVLGTYHPTPTLSGVAVAGNTAFLSRSVWSRFSVSGEIDVVDITNPAAMTMISQFSTPGIAWDLKVDGNHLFVADGDDLLVADITDPTRIEGIGVIEVPEGLNRIDVLGDRIVGVKGERVGGFNESTGIALFDASQCPDTGNFYTRYIPVATAASGAHESQWKTELLLTNPGDDDLLYNLTYTCTNGEGELREISSTGTIEGGSFQYYTDVVNQQAVSGWDCPTGSYTIQSTLPLLADSRIYSLEEMGGFYGQYVPSQSESSLLISGESAILAPLRDDDHYRTNIGFTSFSDGDIHFTLALYDATGNVIATSDHHLSSHEWYQVNARQLGLPAGSSGHIEVTCSEGEGLAAYLSMVDNTTNDATFIPAKRIVSGGREEHLLPVMTYANGAYGTFWMSDLFMSYAGDTPSTATISYTAEGTTTTASVDLAPQETVTMANVIPALLGMDDPPDTTGSMVIEAPADLMVSGRIYNTVDGGTFGQHIPDTAQMTLVTPAQPAVLTYLFNTTQFRSNVGFANASENDLLVTVVMHDLLQNRNVTREYDLPAHGFLQVNDIFTAFDLTSLPLAWAKISVSQGAIAAYASIVDDITGDAVYVPGTPWSDAPPSP